MDFDFLFPLDPLASFLESCQLVDVDLLESKRLLSSPFPFRIRRWRNPRTRRKRISFAYESPQGAAYFFGVENGHARIAASNGDNPTVSEQSAARLKLPILARSDGCLPSLRLLQKVNVFSDVTHSLVVRLKTLEMRPVFFAERSLPDIQHPNIAL